MRLEGKTAFVTGGAGGIGLAIACEFAMAGAKVAIADIDKALLDKAVADHPDLGLVAVECDVSDREAVFAGVNAFAKAHGGVDILVNNAVFFHYEPLEGFDPNVASKMIDVGYKGAIWASQACIPHMRKAGGGSILNLSSVTVTQAFMNTAVYTSIKGAIDALTRQQAAELGGHGIRVNALAPGTVATPGTAKVIDEDGWRSRASKTLIGELPTAQDIAKAGLFLVSDDARCITGVTLKVDSGMTIKGP